MTALYIIGGILFFLLLLLIIPVSAELSYFDRFTVLVKYGGIKVFDSDKPQKPKKPEKSESVPQKKDNKAAKKEGFIKKIFREKGKIGGIKFCFAVLKVALSRIVWVIKKIKFRKLILDIKISSDDAATTAIAYGTVCAVVYPVVNIITRNTDIGIKSVNISTDFDKISPEISVSFSLKTRLIYAFIATISLFFAYIRIKKESEKNE